MQHPVLAVQPRRQPESKDYMIMETLLQEELKPHIAVAVSLVLQCFDKIHGIALEFQEDRDTEESWCVLRVSVKGDVESALSSFDTYTGLWLKQVTWPNSNQVRLSLEISES